MKDGFVCSSARSGFGAKGMSTVPAVGESPHEDGTRNYGLLAGTAAHSLAVPYECERAGVEIDFQVVENCQPGLGNPERQRQAPADVVRLSREE
jgi:hypothetical protein